jgi:TonB family protein
MRERPIAAVVFALMLFAFLPRTALADQCPISVSAVTLEGRSISGSAYHYALWFSSLAGPGRAPTHASVQLTLRGGQPIVQPVDALKFVGGTSGAFALAVFDRPSDDVISASVVSARNVDGNDAKCASNERAVGKAGDGPLDASRTTAIVTFSDPQQVGVDIVAVAAKRSASDSEITEAAFKRKALPDYPQMAQDQNVTGDVSVLIRIAADGSLAKESIDSSSGSKALDDSAMAAAAQSKYRPTLFEDVPVSQEYKVIYAFRFAAGSGRYDLDQILFQNCPVAFANAQLLTGASGGAIHLYDIDLHRQRAGDGLSTIAVGTSSDSTTVQWPLHAVADDKFDDQVSQGGVLYWLGPPVTTLRITSTQDTLAGKAAVCHSEAFGANNTVRQDALVEYATTASPWVTAPEIQSDMPAQFATIAWPAYKPSDEDRSRGSVTMGVTVRVAQDGTPLVAYLDNGSASPAYAKAALDAAMASKYIVPLNADGSIVTETFQIDYVLEI